MKVALVYPSSYSFRRDYSWEVRYIYHGIGLLIASTKKRGIDVDFIDMRRCTDWADYTTKVKGYDIIGFSAMSVDLKMATQAIHYAKIKNPNAIIIVGGTDPSIRTEMWSKNIEVDYIVRGQGEVSFAKLIKQIEAGEKPPKVIEGEPPIISDEPFIDRALWDEEFPWGLRGYTGKPPFKTFLSSRACVYQCTFCQPTADMMFGKGKERRRSVEHMMEEVRAQWPFGGWMIHDDGFTQNQKWIEEFAEAYSAEFPPRPLLIQSRAGFLMREEFVKLMKDKLGLEWTIIGFESGSDKVLKDLNKAQTRVICEKAASTLKKCGVKIFANIMFGTPTETNEDALMTLEMIKNIRPNHYSPTTYMPYPGSYLYDQCKRDGLILTEEGNRYAGAPKIKGVDYDFVNKVLKEGYKYVEP